MADPQAPWTSGSDILSNPGNAALASGSGAGALPFQVDTKPVYSVLDKLYDEDAKMRFQKQAQDREDRQSLSETLGNLKGKGSVFNMKGKDGSNVSFSPLPEDQKVLQEKADELRKAVLKNPDNYDLDPNYLKKKDEYEYLIQHASKRSILHSQNRLAASQATDPEDRAGYLQTNQDEILAHPLSEFHEPDTYIPKPTIDPEKILPAKELADKNNYYTIKTGLKDGIQTDMVGLKDDVADIRSRITPGTPTYVEAVKMSQSFIKSMANDPQGVIAMNDRIAKYNAERGYNPGDPHYQPPVANVTPDGHVLFPARPDPAQIVGAIYFDRHGGLTPDRKQTNIDEQRKNLQSEQKRRQDETSIAYAKLEQDRQKMLAEVAKTRKPTAEELKENLDKQGGEQAYREVKKVYNPANYKDKLPVTPLVEAVAKSVGFNPDEYDFYKVPANLNVNKYIGVEGGETTKTKTSENGQTSTKSKTVESTKTSKGESMRPDMAIMVRNKKTNEQELVFMKDGEVVSKASERQAIANGLKHEARYDDKVYTNKAIYGQYAYDQGAPAEVQAKPPADFTPKYNNAVVETKMDGGVPKALINGKWKKIKSKNSQTGEIKVE